MTLSAFRATLFQKVIYSLKKNSLIVEFLMFKIKELTILTINYNIIISTRETETHAQLLVFVSENTKVGYTISPQHDSVE